MRTKKPEQAEKILCVAARLFATHRFHEARMEDIAAAAEVGKGTLYRYFKDKEQLYTALLDRSSHDLLARVDAALEEVTDPTEQLIALSAAILDYFDANPHLLDLIQHAEAMQRPGQEFRWNEIRVSNMRRTLAIFEEARQAGAWEVRDPELGMLMLLGGLRGVMRFSSPPRAPDLARRIVEDFLRGAANFPAADAARQRRRVEAAYG